MASPIPIARSSIATINRSPLLASRSRSRQRSRAEAMRFAVVLPWWGYLLLFGAALALGWLAYARTPVKLRPGSRIGLSALRTITLIALIVILLRPVVMVPPAAANNSLLPILVDISRSMRLKDDDVS